MKKIKNSTACKFKIGTNIRKWRNIKDVKQKDLAIALEISEAAVSNIENDLSNITIGLLEDISIALGVTIEQLLSDPLEKISIVSPSTLAVNEKEEPYGFSRELTAAMIASLEKKDQQLQTLMQHFLQTMNLLLQQDDLSFNSSKQVTSRA